MKSALAAGVSASIVLAVSSVASAQERRAPAAVPQSEATEIVYDLPLPPARPAPVATQRRVSQAAVVAPAPPPVRKLSSLWLSVGYGF